MGCFPALHNIFKACLLRVQYGPALHRNDTVRSVLIKILQSFTALHVSLTCFSRVSSVALHMSTCIGFAMALTTEK